jgi:hypothetical protein
MPDINLTEQEVQTLLRCLNDRVEPPEELAKKLLPKLYAGFDFKTLNRASIPTAWSSRNLYRIFNLFSDFKSYHIYVP